MYSAGRPTDLHHHWESGCAAKCSPLTKQKNTTLQRVEGGGREEWGVKKKKKKKVTSIALRQLNQRGLNNKLKTTQSVFNISSFIQVVGVLP